MKNFIATAAIVALPFILNAQPYQDTLEIVRPVSDAGVSTTHLFELHTIANHLIFPGYSSATGVEWYKFDGANPPVIAETYPGSNGGIFTAQLRNFSAVINDVVYYLGVHPDYGREIFKWDGVTPPALEFETLPGTVSVQMKSLMAYKSYLYILADSGINNNPHLLEYNTADGSNRRVHTDKGSSLGLPVGFKDKIYFIGIDGINEYNPATKQVKNLGLQYNLRSPIAYGSKLYFFHDFALYDFDGTTVNKLSNNYTLVNIEQPNIILAEKGRIYFWAHLDGKPYNVGLYMYDTASKSVQLTNAPILAGGAPGRYSFCGAYNGDIYYRHHERMMYRYTGTSIDSIGPNNSAVEMFTIYKNIPYMGCRYRDMLKSNLSTWINNAAAGVKQLPPLLKATLYPNPTSVNAYIKLDLKAPEMLTTVVTDITGKKIHSSTATLYSIGSSTIQIPLEHTVPGTYFVNLIDNSGNIIWSSKLLKE